jgi:hypothetical protein
LEGKESYAALRVVPRVSSDMLFRTTQWNANTIASGWAHQSNAIEKS